MPKKKPTLSAIYELEFRNANHRKEPSKKAYEEFVSSIGLDSNILRDHPKTVTLLQLTSELRRILSPKKKNPPTIFLFELSNATYRDFDAFATMLVKSRRLWRRPMLLIIAVGDNESDLKDSVVFRAFIKSIKRVRIAVMVQFQSPNKHPLWLSTYHWPIEGTLPRLRRAQAQSERAKAFQFNKEELSTDIQVVFDHFDIRPRWAGGQSYHIPALLQLNHLVENDRFVSKVRDECSRAVTGPFTLISAPLIEGCGIETLATGLGDIATQIFPTTDDFSGGNCIILADLLVQTNQFDSLIHELQNRGGNVKRIICVAHYQGVQFGTTVHSYFELPYASHEKCAFCTETDRPPLQVSSLGAIEDQLRDFDTSTFWEMIASDTKFYKVGHEIMNRTGYHYHFRIPVKNIFSSHLYAISLRLRNALRQKIYPEWIKKIVCVDDPELDAFAKEMAHRLDLRDVDVVRIPRAELKSVTGAIIDKGVVRRLRSVKRELNRQNVLIVDQAAHQFKTVAAIASICKHFESTVLAFGVFVDRVDPALRLAQHLPFSYYVPLYSWQCGPSQPQDCACQKHHIMAKA